MNDALPVAAAPQARDHAPPERGQEPAPSDAFAAALGAAHPAEAPPPAADPTARTAPAEGTKAEGDSSGPDTRKTADADASGVVTVPMVLPQAAAAAPVPAETASAAVSAVPAGAAPVAAASAAAAAQPSGTAAATTQVTTPAAAPVKAAPADAAPQAAAATPAGPQAAARTDAEAEAATAPAAQTALPATGSQRPAKARAERTGHAPDRKVEHAPRHAPAARSTGAHDVPASGRGPVQARPAGDRLAEAPAQAQAQAAAPADAQTPVTARADGAARIADRPADLPQQAAAPRVRVRDVPDVARATLHVAVRQNGSAMARISLHPADLGGVRITMRVHDGAVSATLAAETPAAAQALTQTVSDLRRSLESQGLQIASLDVRVAGDGPASNGERRQASDLARAMSTTDRAASADAVDITTELHLVPLGTQVDVLA